MRVKPIIQTMMLALSVAIYAGLATVISGCATTSKTAGDSAAAPAADAEAAAPAKGGAELWGETCARCHNLRGPSEFSDAQWSMIVHHMRLQANLTGSEQRTIADFLKSAN